MAPPHACSYCTELQRLAIRRRDLALLDVAIRLRVHAANDAEHVAWSRRGCVKRGCCSGGIGPTPKQVLTRIAIERQKGALLP